MACGYHKRRTDMGEVMQILISLNYCQVRTVEIDGMLYDTYRVIVIKIDG